MFNQLKTLLLLSLLTGLTVTVGRAIGGPSGGVIALGLAAIMNISSWWFSDKIVLAMNGAREIGPDDAPRLWAIVTDLAQRAKMPMPRVYVIPQMQPNAFATGRSPSHAAVAVTEGILRAMPDDELRGVLAHELGHVHNRDTLIMAAAATAAGAISMLASMARWSMIFGGMSRRDDDRGGGGLEAVVAIIVAPLAATLIQLAVSRSREYGADEFSARLLGDATPLMRALNRLERGVEAIPADVSPSFAHVYIVNPLSAKGIMSLFRTHPLTEERIARLQAVAAELR